MKEKFQIQPIGSVCNDDLGVRIQIEQQFIPGLTGLNGFSHLQILWWAHQADSADNRQRLNQGKLFRKGPESLGTFATRSPARPNPVMVSTIPVEEIDLKQGVIFTPFLDAEDGTPVLDIKPYFLMERVRSCSVPAWCEHWPCWFEDKMKFDWREEITEL